ncbi:siderophore-interacting protein [soil metagenome]
MTEEAVYGEVVRVEHLTPRMVRIVLGGPGLASFTPHHTADQYVNALFVPDGAPYSAPFVVAEARSLPPEQRPVGRRYTVRAWDAAARHLTLDFVTHGDEGTAGRWANRAEPGDKLQLTGPSGSFDPDPDADWYLMVGDESALPAIAASIERVPAGRPVVAVLVVDGPDHELPLETPGELRATWLHRAEDPDSAPALVAAIRALELPEGRVHGFIHGEAGETRAVRRHLLGDRAMDPEMLSISPYWRRSYTDERWREVKRQWLAEVAADV